MLVTNWNLLSDLSIEKCTACSHSSFVLKRFSFIKYPKSSWARIGPADFLSYWQTICNFQGLKKDLTASYLISSAVAAAIAVNRGQILGWDSMTCFVD